MSVKMHALGCIYVYVCVPVCADVCEREMVGVCSWGSVSLQGSLRKHVWGV